MIHIDDAIKKAEGFLFLGMVNEAWETLEDLSTDSKNHQRVLELRLECLCILKEWQKAYFLGVGLIVALPESAMIRFFFSCALAQIGQLKEAREHARSAGRLDPKLRLRILEEPALAAMW
jgi:hypothetical protein